MKTLLTWLLISISLVLYAQEPPFWKEIQSFKTSDSLQPPPEQAIVFVGSSSFKMWKNLDQYFPEHAVINRGFGGSSLPHVIDYVDEIVIPYNPKQVVIYCGENDFMSDTVTSDIVVRRFKNLFEILRKHTRAEIIFLSMKPSPSRQHLMPQIAAANNSIKQFLKKKRMATYVDIWAPMLDANGSPRKELFLKDMLHMNESGYAIWQKALEPHLK
jgi:lysophospholipase L1-like esterase